MRKSTHEIIQYINPGLASVAQNTDIIGFVHESNKILLKEIECWTRSVSVTLEHLVIKTLPSGLEIAAVIFVLLGTSSLPLFRYWESLKESWNFFYLCFYYKNNTYDVNSIKEGTRRSRRWCESPAKMIIYTAFSKNFFYKIFLINILYKQMRHSYFEINNVRSKDTSKS